MARTERTNFGSRLGIILASAGSAVGLGNIWRFPYETGEHGGAVFILVYIGCVLFIGIPVMVSEFLIGRHSQSNTARAYQRLAPGTPWKGVGFLAVLSAFLILSYYSVVAGWTLEYIFDSATNRFAGKQAADFSEDFNLFMQSSFRPLLWLVCFLLMTYVIVVRGIKNGIEKSSKLMMPLLFIIILILAVCSICLPNGKKGVEFLFSPDFSKIDSGMLLSAMGQVFYSLSLGMGALCTYASYFKRDTNLTKTAISVGTIDTLIAILAGLVIFPAAFSVGIAPDTGPSLVFITLPNVFQQAFGNMPILSYICSLMFYILLALAALTSTISLHEVVTAYLHEEFNLTRRTAATIVTAGCLLIGSCCSLSLGIGKEWTIAGMTLFDLFDYVTAKVMLPIGALLTCLFVGWYLQRKLVYAEVSNEGRLKVGFFYFYLILIRIVAPIAIIMILLKEWGLLK